MQIVAKVLDVDITLRDIEHECLRIKKESTPENRHIALERLIDRCLIFSKAHQLGFKVTDTEYDNALMELLDQDDPLGLTSDAIQDLTADELERLLNRHLIIKKYMQKIKNSDMQVTSQKIHEFYEAQKDIFLRGECVRCSHILIRHAKDAAQRIKDIRSQIRNESDFIRISKEYSDCPSNATCGDLGWFHLGKMIHEIEVVAFAMKVGEISQPFESAYGYHILLLNDRKDASYIPFEDIQESLSSRLQQIEKELVISRHITELRQQFADRISILNTDIYA